MTAEWLRKTQTHNCSFALCILTCCAFPTGRKLYWVVATSALVSAFQGFTLLWMDSSPPHGAAYVYRLSTYIEVESWLSIFESRYTDRYRP